jgi:hypothetical protein
MTFTMSRPVGVAVSRFMARIRSDAPLRSILLDDGAEVRDRTREPIELRDQKHVVFAKIVQSRLNAPARANGGPSGTPAAFRSRPWASKPACCSTVEVLA